MNKLLITLLIFGNTVAFAATDAQLVGAVFSDQEFVSAMGDENLDDIKITNNDSNRYKVVVNERAPLADGCSFSANVTETKERYAISPSATGLRTVLKVSKIKKKCGMMR